MKSCAHYNPNNYTLKNNQTAFAGTSHHKNRVNICLINDNYMPKCYQYNVDVVK